MENNVDFVTNSVQGGRMFLLGVYRADSDICSVYSLHDTKENSVQEKHLFLENGREKLVQI